VLETARARLRMRDWGFRLLTPTATMAEHLRNLLAREGFVFPPSLAITLGKFVEELTPNVREISTPALGALLQQVLNEGVSAEFAGVARYPGFVRACTSLIRELSAAGCSVETLGTVHPALAGIYEKVLARLEARSLLLRSQRVATACGAVGRPARTLLFDGFSSFSNREIDLIAALGAVSDVTITLPDGAVSADTLLKLRGLGAAEQHLGSPVRTEPRRIIVAAPSETREAEEIARRILDVRTVGCSFRDIGIVIRSEQPYVPLLRTTLARFGIPSRFYFGTPLAAHPTVRFLAGCIEGMLSGWDYGPTLDAIGLGCRETDVFESEVRRIIPGAGLERLRERAKSRRIVELIDELSRLDAWRMLELPPAEWAQRFASLTSLVESPSPGDLTPERIEIWRGQATAVKQFQAALEEAASVFDAAGTIAVAEFWSTAKAVIEEVTLRAAEHRHDVVHVMDVHEGRQWELPVVFVCGMLEKQFPRYHAEDSLLSDAHRRQLNVHGLRLRTSADRDAEEAWLFEVARTRATQLQVFTYNRFNPAGDENLRSFYLDSIDAVCEHAVSVRPESARTPGRSWHAEIRDPELLEILGTRHRLISPTAVETFLNCPFQFFIRKSLRLEELPPRPHERLDPLLQGTIVHAALYEWHVEGGSLREIADRVFEEICSRKNVPPGWRRELARLDIQRALERVSLEPRILEGWTLHAEEEIEVPLNDELTVKGRIDRYEVSPQGTAVVLDYKYSGGTRLRQLKTDERAVQAALYLAALSRKYGYKPGGMFYWALKEKANPFYGWHASLPEFEGQGEWSSPREFELLLDEVIERTLDAAAQIRSGAIAPVQYEKCKFCEARDVCRVEIDAESVIGAAL
jgi:ATP-dependent helicase/DNAse subunit B